MPRSRKKNTCTEKDRKTQQPGRVREGIEIELGNEKDNNEGEKTASKAKHDREIKRTKHKNEQKNAATEQEQELHCETMINRARKELAESAEDKEATANAQKE